jgi:serine/threonine-protein kinase
LIRLHLLGTVDLRRDAVEVRSVLSQPKRLALLAYLASATPRGFHSRETLLGLFWPESDAERARNSLRQALHQLRRSLGDDALASRADREVGVDPAVFWCDAAAFDDAVDEGRWEDALKLYRGDLLPGFFIDDAPDAERWLEEERTRRRRAAVDAAWKLADQEEARGEWRAAALWAQRALGLAPEETGIRRLMGLLQRAGEPAAALAAFAEFERRLDAEYGLSPSAETMRMVEQLRAPRADPSATTPIAAAAPIPPAAVSPAPSADPLASATPVPEPAPSSSAATETTRTEVPASASTPLYPHVPPVAPEPAPGTSSPEPVRTDGHRRRKRWMPYAVAAAAVLLLLIGGWALRGRRSAAPEAAPAEAPSIAVLPFVNLSGDPENDYFSDGLSEELLNVLAQLPELRVAARTSSFRYRGNDVPVDSIGRALRVGHVLEGSVRQEGPRVRVTAQLIETGTGFHLWSANYDRELRDVFAIQDEISRAIVRELQVKLTGPRAGRSLARQETADPEAHALVLKGQYVQGQATREALAQAAAFFEQATQRDPRYGRAYAMLASNVQFQAYRRYIPTDEGYARAKSLARQALALDSALLPAHATLARVAELHEWDFRAAEAHYRRATELNPNANLGYTPRAFLLMRLGRTDEALVAARRSAELSPDRPATLNNLGAIYGFAGRYPDAIQAFQSAMALDRENPSSAIGLALTYTYMGRHADALAAAEPLRARADDQAVLGTLGYVDARAGRHAQARQALRAVEAQPDASRYARATVHAGLGEHEQAFALLDQAVRAREGEVADLGIDPSFAPLRDDPRMAALLRRIGLPDVR